MNAPEAAAPVRLAIEDGVATVTLDRPEARNAISSALATELAEVFEPLSTNREVRAVVLTGAGERAFTAGSCSGRSSGAPSAPCAAARCRPSRRSSATRLAAASSWRSAAT
jgi:enoyl-CoA hydratase/carnithine racemase